YIAVLERLAERDSKRAAHDKSATYLRSALAVDPFREDLQRALMESLASNGSPAAALLVYRQYRALLGREIAGEPAEETPALFRRLQEETRLVAAPSLSPQGNLAQSPGREPAARRRTLPVPLTALIGRDAEVSELVSLAARTRLITLTGTGGVGKTRLAIRT